MHATYARLTLQLQGRSLVPRTAKSHHNHSHNASHSTPFSPLTTISFRAQRTQAGHRDTRQSLRPQGTTRCCAMIASAAAIPVAGTGTGGVPEPSSAVQGSVAQTSGASPRVVICGGGIIGSAIAYYLALRGVAATVVERTEIACAASGGSSTLWDFSCWRRINVGLQALLFSIF